jgi:SAM-dependent methyltransferase
MTIRGMAERSASFYGPALAKIYDGAMGDAAMPALLAGVRGALARLRIDPRSMADVGCGTGRLLGALGDPNRKLYCVDCAPAMLDIAARRLADLPATLLRQDARDFALPEKVDLVLCTFATLNYLRTETDLTAAFTAFRRNLRPGGHLIFDYIPLGSAESGPSFARQFVHTSAGRSVWQIRIDPARGWTETRIMFAGQGRMPRTVERHVQQWHDPAQIRVLLLRSGLMPLFSIPLGEGGPSRWLLTAARRPARGRSA